MTLSSSYRGRFAPSPTGPLHEGSLVAALASWLDARAHGGTWLVRIEDVDTPRCEPGAGEHILVQLAACGLVPDEPPWWQSTRHTAYDIACKRLRAAGRAFACGCTRSDVAQAVAAAGQVRPRHSELVYPGTCREGLHGKPARAVRALSTTDDGGPAVIDWHDRRLGAQQQDITTEVGDFVLHRADGLWAYQLAVVVDDAEQGITHIVRGEDLADNTARQIHLQRALGVPTPFYLHTPLVRDGRGEKLSKQHGAQAVDLSDPVAALQRAGEVLGLAPVFASLQPSPSTADWLARATRAWLS
ncbi:MAG: tRNA glutamyl-Q(34) synthetase GluQRS [Pseudomonadota bacterium]